MDNENNVYKNNPTNDLTQENNDADINKQKGFAIAAMVCGIVSLVISCFIYLSIPLAILALIFGIISLNKIKKNNVTTGKGMAIAGIILGAVTLVLLIVVIILGVIGLNMMDINDLSEFSEFY